MGHGLCKVMLAREGGRESETESQMKGFAVGEFGVGERELCTRTRRGALVIRDDTTCMTRYPDSLLLSLAPLSAIDDCVTVYGS